MGTTENMATVSETFAAGWSGPLPFDVRGVDEVNTATLVWHAGYQRKGHESFLAEMSEMILATGIFLGEVIRRLHGSAAVLEWETYEEALARDAQLVEVLGPRSLGNSVLLTPSDR